MSILSRLRYRQARVGARGLLVFTATLLLIEFADELSFNVLGAAMPRIRDDLRISYTQIGLLLAVPLLVSSLIEPIIGVLGDLWRRKTLIVGGGLIIAAAFTAVAAAQDFTVLLIAMLAAYPAGGAFVGLSQATLMDSDPGREEQLMARWTAVGSAGYVAGPLLVTAVFALGFGWRGLMLGLALAVSLLAVAMWRQPFRNGQAAPEGEASTGGYGLRDVWQAARNPALLRWIGLLYASDLMLDVLIGFVALYFTDVLGVSAAAASAALVVMSAVGFAGDVLLIPMLERVRGLRLLRWSSAAVLGLYVAWLLIDWLPAKYGLLALVGLGATGWYQVLQGRAYATLPGRSGTVMAVGSLGGLVGSLIPLGLGWVAEQHGLTAALWCLAVGPLSLILFLPREQK
jgi:FSR family fosmidomycin resistance protein-like MFS transporter